MLLQFSVTNHRSIKNKSVIGMKATKEINSVMAIYGVNAAGKSNVLHALMLMREMICGKYAKPLKGGKLPQEPFCFTKEENVPTEFEVIYYYDGIKYAYGYSFDREYILKEYLYHWSNGQEVLIFSRENNNYQFDENIQEQLILANRTSSNRLYLVCSNEWNCKQTEKAYLWFVEKMKSFLGAEMDFRQTLSLLQEDKKDKQCVLREMMSADFEIKDVIITGTTDAPIISMVHSIYDANGEDVRYSLPLELESVGMQKFFAYIGFWLETLKTGSVLVVDGIESNMHPLLTRHLIEMFQDSETNVKKAQLIITTHDTGLIDSNFLQCDQAWFAEKDEKTKQTSVYALSDFSLCKGISQIMPEKRK